MTRAISAKNPIENLLAKVPPLSTAHAYGQWFAAHTADWKALELKTVLPLHVHAILNHHTNLEIEAQKKAVVQALQQQWRGAKIALDAETDAFFYELLKVNSQQKAWDRSSEQPLKEFVEGYLAALGKPFSPQHTWAVQLHWHESSKLPDGVLDWTVEELSALHDSSWPAKNKAFEKIFEKAVRSLRCDVVQACVENAWVTPKFVQDLVSRLNKPAEVLPSIVALNTVVVLPLTLAGKLLEGGADEKIQQCVFDILLKNAATSEREEMVKAIVYKHAASHPHLVGKMLDTPELVPDRVQALSRLVSFPSFPKLFSMLPVEERRSSLPTMVEAYQTARVRRAGFDEAIKFAQCLVETFPVEEQPTITMHVLSRLMEEVSPVLSAHLQRNSLQLGLAEPAPSAPKRRM